MSDRFTTSLRILRFITRFLGKYNYFDGGADHWDKYAERLASEDVPNLVNSTIELLKTNQSYIDVLLAKYKHVNVIDVGVGNAYPITDSLRHIFWMNENLADILL